LSGVGTSRVGYLDGIRGWAALSVVVYHATWELLRDLNPAPRQTKFILINDGKFAVLVFFVLSGFALSTGFFRTNRADIVRHLALRRYIRLAVPIAAVTLLAIALSKSGLFFNEAAAQIARYKVDWLRFQYSHVDFSAEAAKYILYHVYVLTDGNRYGPFLWTMSWEMQGSFLVFGLLLLIRIRGAERFLWYIVALTLTLNTNSPFACFIFGVMLADFEAGWLGAYVQERARLTGLIGLLLFAGAAAYRWSVEWLGPYGGIVDMVAATMVIAGVVLSRHLQTLFQWRVSRYLGAVSFPLYLCHALVLCSVGSWLIVALHTADYPTSTIFLVVPAAVIAGSLVLATLLLPVERLAISIARRFSVMMMSEALPDRIRRMSDHARAVVGWSNAERRAADGAGWPHRDRQ
jgi:peptidoglycan/LPS O-acetylase OafA/YrhL